MLGISQLKLVTNFVNKMWIKNLKWTRFLSILLILAETINTINIKWLNQLFCVTQKYPLTNIAVIQSNMAYWLPVTKVLLSCSFRTTFLSNLFFSVSRATFWRRNWAMCRSLLTVAASLQLTYQHYTLPCQRLSISTYETKLWDWKCKNLLLWNN